MTGGLDPVDPGDLPERFLAWARHVGSESPLYDHLCRRVAGDPEVLGLLTGTPAGQPTANILFASVHYLLLGGADSPLSAHYPTVTGSTAAPRDDAWPLFKAFCLDHEEEIRHLTSTRTVQTNEVGRSAVWLPGLAVAGSDEPMAVVELGAAAGLNLRFDRYHYDYGVARAGDPGAGLVLMSEVRGSLIPPIPIEMPFVAWRRGIDLQPIEAHDMDRVRWAAALIWPNQIERMQRMNRAMDIARAIPVDVIAGDAVSSAAATASEAPHGLRLVLMHSFMLNQVDRAGREILDRSLAELSTVRSVDRLSLEWLRPDKGPMLRLTRYREGSTATSTLAAAHHHGAWIEWLDQASGTPRTASSTDSTGG